MYPSPRDKQPRSRQASSALRGPPSFQKRGHSELSPPCPGAGLSLRIGDFRRRPQRITPIPRVFALLLVEVLFSCADFDSMQTLAGQILGSHTKPPSHEGRTGKDHPQITQISQIQEEITCVANSQQLKTLSRSWPTHAISPCSDVSYRGSQEGVYRLPGARGVPLVDKSRLSCC
jgi:hypothetical protein